MTKTILIFGLIAGAILSVMFLITLPFHDELGSDSAMVLGYATMIAAFLLIFFGVRQYRDNVSGGTVSFGRAFTVGILIAAVASACYVATWEVIYFGGFAPNYLENYQAEMLTKARAEGKSQAELDKMIAEQQLWLERYKNPAINAAMTFMEPLPVALVIALVSAGVLRRRTAVV